MIDPKEKLREKIYFISIPLTDIEHEMKSIAELYNRLPVDHPDREKLYEQYMHLNYQNIFD